jgi:hypothetical protein
MSIKQSSTKSSNSIKNTQLVSEPSQYDTSRMVFADVKEYSSPNGIKYKRISINTVNPDGSVGNLILQTERNFSYGLKENTDFNDPTKITGYSLPIALWSKDGPTDGEKEFTDKFDDIIKQCAKHVVSIKNELKRPRQTEEGLLQYNPDSKFNPLWWKRDEDLQILSDSGPTLYAPLVASKKDGLKILTKFFDEDTDEPIDPLELLGKSLFSTSAIIFDSIFIGSGKILVQVKLWEASVELIETGMKRLLVRRGGSGAKKSVGRAGSEESDEEKELFSESEDEAPVEKRMVVKKR